MIGKTMPEDLLSIPTIDWQDYKKKYNADQTLGDSILTLLSEELANDIKSILLDYKAKNYEKMAFDVHKLKGASVYACTTRLTSILTQTEKKIMMEQYDEIGPFVSFLSQELNDIINEIKNKPPT